MISSRLLIAETNLQPSTNATPTRVIVLRIISQYFLFVLPLILIFLCTKMQLFFDPPWEYVAPGKSRAWLPVALIVVHFCSKYMSLIEVHPRPDWAKRQITVNPKKRRKINMVGLLILICPK